MKIINVSQKILETLLGKTEVIQNWCFWYFKGILESFYKMISGKSGKKYEEIVKKLWKNIENTSQELKIKHFGGNCVKFSR